MKDGNIGKLLKIDGCYAVIAYSQNYDGHSHQRLYKIVYQDTHKAAYVGLGDICGSNYISRYEVHFEENE